MKTQKTIIESVIGKVGLGAVALLLGLHIGTVQAATIFTDGHVGASGIHLVNNWDNGLPIGANAGTVSTEYSTTYFNTFVADNYQITYNGASSLTGVSASIALAGGTSLTFNDSSTFTVGGRLTIGSVGSAEVVLNGNASATVAERLIFGSVDTTGASLSLSGNSSFATSTNPANTVVLGGTGNNYNLTLSDSAVFQSNASSWGINSNTITVNFEQANPNFTPTFKLNEVMSFSGAFFLYQINGVATTLADERFVLTEGVNGYDTLTVIPEPSSLLLMSMGALLFVFTLRRRNRA